MARVLIVDDEPDVLLLLRLALEGAGFETALAADGDVALQRISQVRFDLVLLDVMMPVLDGWGVLRALKNSEHPPPVIVLSAGYGQRDIDRAKELGARDYLTKPFEMDALVALIGRVIEGIAPAGSDVATGPSLPHDARPDGGD